MGGFGFIFGRRLLGSFSGSPVFVAEWLPESSGRAVSTVVGLIQTAAEACCNCVGNPASAFASGRIWMIGKGTGCQPVRRHRSASAGMRLAGRMMSRAGGLRISEDGFGNGWFDVFALQKLSGRLTMPKSRFR